MLPKKKVESRSTSRTRLRWVLIALVIGVLTLSILAFISPLSQTGQATTPSPTGAPTGDSETLTGERQMTQIAEAEALPPTPEEIGYTTGIIFMSTLLILILLLGTLREILLRKDR